MRRQAVAGRRAPPAAEHLVRWTAARMTSLHAFVLVVLTLFFAACSQVPAATESALPGTACTPGESVRRALWPSCPGEAATCTCPAGYTLTFPMGPGPLCVSDEGARVCPDSGLWPE